MDKCFGKVLILFVISVLYVEKAVDIICIPVLFLLLALALVAKTFFYAEEKKI